jgi:hypothetical protein
MFSKRHIYLFFYIKREFISFYMYKKEKYLKFINLKNSEIELKYIYFMYILRKRKEIMHSSQPSSRNYCDQL